MFQIAMPSLHLLFNSLGTPDTLQEIIDGIMPKTQTLNHHFGDYEKQIVETNTLENGS